MGSYIAEYYKMGLYTREDIELFASVDMITEEEKQSILGA